MGKEINRLIFCIFCIVSLLGCSLFRNNVQMQNDIDKDYYEPDEPSWYSGLSDNEYGYGMAVSDDPLEACYYSQQNALRSVAACRDCHIKGMFESIKKESGSDYKGIRFERFQNVYLISSNSMMYNCRLQRNEVFFCKDLNKYKAYCLFRVE